VTLLPQIEPFAVGDPLNQAQAVPFVATAMYLYREGCLVILTATWVADVLAFPAILDPLMVKLRVRTRLVHMIKEIGFQMKRGIHPLLKEYPTFLVVTMLELVPPT